MKLTSHISKKLIPVVFFLIVFIIGVLVFKDYGVHYDEKCQIVIGVTNYRYINQGDNGLYTFQDRYYGPFFELPLVILSNSIPAPGMVYFRHFSVFVTFFAGLIALYFLAYRLFRDFRWALLVPVLVVVSPRLFADAFYNSKDIPFLVVLIFGILSLLYWLDLLDQPTSTRPLLTSVILHAFISAAAITTRIPGIMLFLFTIGFTLLKQILGPVKWKKLLVLLAGYTTLTFGFVFVFTPILWHDPIGEFVNAIQQMSRYNLWMGEILFQGQSFPANNPVWSYLPVWIGITTPYLVLISFFTGCILMCIRGGKAFSLNKIGSGVWWKNILAADSMAWLVVIAWLIVPVSSIYILKSVLYDAWRQMFFIYPPIALIGVYGLRNINRWVLQITSNSQKMKSLLLMILLVGLLEPFIFMVRKHPFENVYFNALAGDPATLRQRFELDYWGLSYKQGIDFILANDPRDHIVLSAVGPASLYVEYMLPREQAARITFTEPENADYFLTNYRWHPEDFNYPEKYYSIFVRGTEIMTVYRIKLTDSGG